jgi:hypothetical protein
MLRKRSAVVLALFATGACAYHPHLQSASASKGADGLDVDVSVSISRIDAQYIKDRQYYFSLVLTDCGGARGEFPFDGYINGGKSPNFNMEGSQSTIKVIGQVPHNIYQRYRDPCIMLRGGSYFYGKVRSTKVRIGSLSS